MMKTAAPIVLALALVACNAGGSHPGRIADTPPAMSVATQLLGPNGEFHGTATLTQVGGDTRIRARVEGLPPGTHALHLHSVGKCEGPKFTSAGGHFNPGMKMHGKDNPMGPHLGDLPNIDVGPGGTGTTDFTVAGMLLIGGPAPLLDADAAALVVHIGPDDYRTDPSGNSGDRIACGAFAPT